MLRRDLGGERPVSRGDVLDSIEAVYPCIEIIDSRFDWRLTFVDTVADNGSSARCVFGPPVELSDLDLQAVQATLTRNGSPLGTATGEAVLGHPADAVAWLANTLVSFGESLHAGDYVLSGSFMAAKPGQPGDRFGASFTGVGEVAFEFS